MQKKTGGFPKGRPPIFSVFYYFAMLKKPSSRAPGANAAPVGTARDLNEPRQEPAVAAFSAGGSGIREGADFRDIRF